MKTLLLIDANALIHRFFHALPPFTGPDGAPTNALYGLSNVMLKILNEQKPEYVAAAFDTPEPTFREKEFAAYKAQRAETASELIPQLKKAPQVFESYGIRTFAIPGFEADDLVGSFVEMFREEKDLRIVIMSGDRDVLQLVEDDKIVGQMFKTGVTETIIYDEKGVEAKYGLKPKQLPDYKGLVGDVSDNIPGIKGVGPKTTATLLKEFGTLEEVFDNIAIITNRTVSKKLEGRREEALFSKRLATIRRDAPIGVSDLESLKVPLMDKEKLKTFFQSLGFKSLVERMGK